MKKMKEGEFWFPYWGAIVMKTVVSNAFKDKLLTEGKKTKKDFRNELAGMIEKEFLYKDFEDWFFPEILPLLNVYQDQYLNSWGGKLDDIKTPFAITHSNLWINYQKSGEFNPRHGHSGDLSFVVYLKIPEELKKENEEKKLIHNNLGTGTIKFHFGENLPFSVFVHEELPEEANIFIFPAWLQHSVSPFFSDVERISASGNIWLQRNEI